MKKSVIKFPTSFIRNRRIDLGLTQSVVCKAIGMEEWTYQKLEQRGQIPEEHIPGLAKILRVTEQELWIEKMTPMMKEIFAIAKEPFRQFVISCDKVNPRLGNLD